MKLAPCNAASFFPFLSHARAVPSRCREAQLLVSSLQPRKPLLLLSSYGKLSYATLNDTSWLTNAAEDGKFSQIKLTEALPVRADNGSLGGFLKNNAKVGV